MKYMIQSAAHTGTPRYIELYRAGTVYIQSYRPDAQDMVTATHSWTFVLIDTPMQGP